jgi:hypothetical protein
MDDLEKMAAFGSVTPAWREGIDTAAGATGGLTLAAVTFDLIEQVGRDWAEALTAVRAETYLSEAGKKKRLQAVAVGALERLEKAREHIARLRREAADTRADAHATVTSDTVTTAIWRWLERLDPLAVELAYREALAVGDAQTADAIESLPVVHPARIEAHRLAALRNERVRAENPAAAQRAAAIEAAAQDLEARAEAVEEDIRRAIGASDTNERSGAGSGADATTSDGPADVHAEPPSDSR